MYFHRNLQPTTKSLRTLVFKKLRLVNEAVFFAIESEDSGGGKNEIPVNFTSILVHRRDCREKLLHKYNFETKRNAYL